MTRIAIISHSHPVLKSGGGEVAAHRQFEHLRAHDADAVFIGMAFEPKAIAAVFAPDQTVLQLGPKDYCLRATGMDSFTMEHDRLQDENTVFDLLMTINADIYHFHHFWNIGAGVIRRLRQARPDARLICTLHELTAICANHGQMVKTGGRQLCYASGPLACSACFPAQNALDFVLRKRRMMEMINQFDALIAPSQFLARRFEDWGVQPKRIHVLENGLAPRSDDAIDEIPVVDLSRRFAFFGQATPTKGLDVLVRALQWIAAQPAAGDLSVDIYGVTQADFEEIWPDMPLPLDLLYFHGRYQATDAVHLMARYGWVIVPSVWWENSPVVIQEARLARTPVIASNIGGMKEKVEGWGHLFEVGDPMSLGQKMVALAGNGDALMSARNKIENPLCLDEFMKLWAVIAQYEF